MQQRRLAGFFQQVMSVNPIIPSRPPSASRFTFNLAAGLAGLGFLFWLQQQAPDTPHGNGLAAALLVAMLIALHELFRLRTHRNPSSGLDWDRPPDYNLSRALVKLFGLYMTLGAVAGAYALFPEYHGDFYAPFWDALRHYGLPMLWLAPVYFWWVDARMQEPRDGYWHMGNLPWQILTGRWADVDSRAIGRHMAGWIVKGFFLPLMVVYLGSTVRDAHGAWLALSGGGYSWFNFLFHLTYAIDILFGVIGYALTLRLLDAHIRWVEPTAFGWLVTLICYQPFYSLIHNFYLQYDDGLMWGQWLADVPMVKLIWAIIVTGLLATYALATVAFGVRFSNLTARGIITDGPYRFSKHPAYLSKNLSYWMISIPFIAASPTTALSNSLHLLLINLIYFLRARTEERHLSRDPDYVRYALWMNEHGLLARLGRWIPLLSYRPDEATVRR